MMRDACMTREWPSSRAPQLSHFATKSETTLSCASFRGLQMFSNKRKDEVIELLELNDSLHFRIPNADPLAIGLQKLLN